MVMDENSNQVNTISLFEKYNEEFGKIGDRIDSLHKQYDEVNNTRAKKLQKVVDKINIEDKSKAPSLTP
jgi:DNA anti-recombination protein RmuC